MKYLSTFSGIEAASVAWEPLGFEPVGFSEIEPFPSAVLAHRFPQVKNYGDINRHPEWGIEPGSVDILVGGSPCQSFSAAGLKLGLADPRGNLALVFAALAHRIRPRWIIWENVPGVLSSNGGRDFASFLESMALGGFVGGWRVLNSRFFGIPQSRRRVFALFNSRGDIDGVAKILFERGSPGKVGRANEDSGEGDSLFAGGSLRDSPSPYAIKGTAVWREHHNGASGTNAGVRDSGEPMFTLTKMDIHAVAVPPVAFTVGNLYRGAGPSPSTETFGTLTSQAGDQKSAVASPGCVRFITPREAERLQGFPDDWTRIPWKGKSAEECPDRPRYAACGNSMAVPVMRWLGSRLKAYEEGGLE